MNVKEQALLSSENLRYGVTLNTQIKFTFLRTDLYYRIDYIEECSDIYHDGSL